MERQTFIYNLVAAVFAFSSGFGNALSAPSDDASLIATQVTSAVQEYVSQYGRTHILLTIDPATGLLSENMLMGTSTTLEICQNFVVAHTNFSTKEGQEVTGNFILRKADVQLEIVDYSFGQDPSLRRLQEGKCYNWSSEVPDLRRVTF